MNKYISDSLAAGLFYKTLKLYKYSLLYLISEKLDSWLKTSCIFKILSGFFRRQPLTVRYYDNSIFIKFISANAQYVRVLLQKASILIGKFIENSIYVKFFNLYLNLIMKSAINSKLIALFRVFGVGCRLKNSTMSEPPEKHQELLRKYLTSLIFIAGLTSTILTLLYFHSVKLSAAVFLATLFISLLLYDFQRFLYVAAFYPLLDFLLRQYAVTAASIWDELFILLLLILSIFKSILYRKSSGSIKLSIHVILPMTLFFVSCLASFFFRTTNIQAGIDGIRTNAQYMLFFIVFILLFRNFKGILNFLYFLCTCGLVMGIHGVYQYIIGVTVPAAWMDKAEEGLRTRVFSVMGNSNALASILVLLIPIAISLVFYERNTFRKLYFSLAAAAMLSALVFTFTRSAWFGFILSYFVFILLYNRKWMLPSILSFILAGGIIVILIPSIGDRILFLFSETYMSSSASGGRIIRWTLGMELLGKNLIFGVGPGRFGGAVAANYGFSDSFYMDNYYLKTAVELGLAGLLPFIALIWSLLSTGIRNSMTSSGLMRKSLASKTPVYHFSTDEGAINDNKPYIKTKQYTYTNTGNNTRILAIGSVAGIFSVLIQATSENVFDVPALNALFWMVAAILVILGSESIARQAVRTR